MFVFIMFLIVVEIEVVITMVFDGSAGGVVGGEMEASNGGWRIKDGGVGGRLRV